MSQEVPATHNSPGVFRRVLILVLRVALVAAIAGAGWLIYRGLPASYSGVRSQNTRTTNLEIVLHQMDNGGVPLNVTINLFPVDIVAVHHEFLSEPRPGKRLDDFVKERMKGRSPVTTQLDNQGHGSVVLTSGSWWLLTKLSGDEVIEWRLPVTVAGPKQVIELTSQNAYTRSRTF
ncbi:MAG TPA: hypothetical protein VJ749_09885 [Pyrinomonadaceae bacterium]|jgi:hypothetical protein|nr:hypothetical protein [Pyrinomonadaceae bacterium]